jgi:HEAT repeat protein
MMELESSPHVRASVAAALGAIGPGAKAALPVLQKAAEDKNPEVRQNALFAMGNILMWVPADVRIGVRGKVSDSEILK